MRDTTRAGGREWLGLAVLVLPTLLISLDMSVLFLALPHLSADLGANGVEQLWISDIYTFVLAGLLITMGTLGDRIGRRRLLLLGAALFGVASVAAALSTSVGMLIAARAAMGLGGSTLMPSTLALISTMFRDPRQRGVAISIWAGCMMAGGALGPVVGGLLLSGFWWGSVFLMGVPVMVLTLVLGPLLLPEHRSAEAGRPDPISVVLSMAAVLPLVYALKELAAYGPAPLPFAAIAAGAAAGAVFVGRQRSLADPLVDVRLFGNRAFVTTLGVMMLAGGTLGGMYLLVAQYVQAVEGLSAARAGTWLAAAGAGIAVGSLLAPVLARWLGPQRAIAAGLVLAAAGFLALALVDGPGATGLVVAGAAAGWLGVGPTVALGTDLVVGSVPPARAGSAASLSETSSELGFALGLAVFGSIATAVYTASMSGAGGEAARGVAGAVEATGRLGPAAASELLDAARAAFTAAMNTAAGIGAVLFLALAALILTAFRPARADRDVPVSEDVTTLAR